MTSLALVPKLATRLRNLHCHIALECPVGIIISIELVSLWVSVTSDKSQKGLLVVECRRTFGPIDWTPAWDPHVHGSNKNLVLKKISEIFGLGLKTSRSQEFPTWPLPTISPFVSFRIFVSVWVSFRSRDFWILLLVSELFLKKIGYEESHTIGLVLENGSESVLKNSVQKKVSETVLVRYFAPLTHCNWLSMWYW